MAERSIAEIIGHLRSLLPKVTPGEWFYNGYAGIYSVDLSKVENDQEWPEGLDAAAEEKFYREHVYHQTESRVAGVPPIAGDTATGRHAHDAVWIETLCPANVARLLDEFDRLAAAVRAVAGEPDEA